MRGSYYPLRGCLRPYPSFVQGGAPWSPGDLLLTELDSNLVRNTIHQLARLFFRNNFILHWHLAQDAQCILKCKPELFLARTSNK